MYSMIMNLRVNRAQPLVSFQQITNLRLYRFYLLHSSKYKSILSLLLSKGDPLKTALDDLFLSPESFWDLV